MKNKNFIFSVVLIILITPAITFAAWWNPLSWNVWSIFKKDLSKSEIVQVKEIQNIELLDNAKIEELEKQEVILTQKNEVESDEEGVEKEVKKAEQVAKPKTDPDLITELDTWTYYSVVQGGVVTVPNYQERINKLNRICDYIERVIKTNLTQYKKELYCSVGARTTMTSNSDITIGIGYLDYMKNTKNSKKMTSQAWELVLDFEKSTSSIFEPKIEEKIRKDQIERERIERLQKIELERREREQLERVIRQNETRTQQQSQSSLNCGNYNSEKSALDNMHSRNGTLFSSARKNDEAALQAKYAQCF